MCGLQLHETAIDGARYANPFAAQRFTWSMWTQKTSCRAPEMPSMATCWSTLWWFGHWFPLWRRSGGPSPKSWQQVDRPAPTPRDNDKLQKNEQIWSTFPSASKVEPTAIGRSAERVHEQPDVGPGTRRIQIRVDAHRSAVKVVRSARGAFALSSRKWTRCQLPNHPIGSRSHVTFSFVQFN